MNIVDNLAALLLEKRLMMGTAESCTGGMIAHLITSKAGSSAYFKGSVVSYCNEVHLKVIVISYFYERNIKYRLYYEEM